MKTTKQLQNCDVELAYLSLNQGCRVSIEASNPNLLFLHYKDDLISLKEDLEEVCDIWVEELGKNIHTQFTLPVMSFTSEDISLTREYSF